MARLVHLSDLHFGAHDEELVAAVERSIMRSSPTSSSSAAISPNAPAPNSSRRHAEFLDRLRDAGHEVIGVPGNHDVPLYDVLRRFLSPLTRYRRYIDETLCPFIELSGRCGPRDQHRAVADVQGRTGERGASVEGSVQPAQAMPTLIDNLPLPLTALDRP